MTGRATVTRATPRLGLLLLLWACGTDTPTTSTELELTAPPTPTPSAEPAQPGGAPTPSPTPVAPVTFADGEVPAPERSAWDNGVRCYFLAAPSSQLVHITLALRAGAVYEPQGKDGLAELTARSVREGGTRTLPKEALEARLFALGAALDVVPGDDAVVFHVSAPAASYGELLELFASMILTPSLTPQGVHRERDRLREALVQRGAGQPETELLWAWRHGERADGPPRLQQLADLGAADVTSFHGIHYRPTRAALGITGPLDRRAAEALAMKAFAAWRADSPGPTRARPQLPTGSVAFSAPAAGKPATGPARVAILIPTPPPEEADAVAHEVLLDIFLGDGLGGRLGRAVQSAGLQSVTARVDRRATKAGGQVLVDLQVPTERTQDALDAVRKALLSLSDESPQRDECEAAVARVRGNVLRDCATAARQIQQECVAAVLGQGLAPHTALLRLDGVGITAVREVLRQHRSLEAAFLQLGGARPERTDVVAMNWPGSTVRDSGSGRPATLPEGARERGQALLTQAILALGGREFLSEIAALEWKSVVRGVEALRIDDTWTVRLPDRLRRTRQVLGTRIHTVVQGDKGSERSPRTNLELTKEECQSLLAGVRRYPVLVLAEIAREGHEVVWLHRERVDGRDWEVLEVRPKGRREFRITVDRESGLVRRVTGTVWRAGRGEVEVEEEFQDYRPVGKVRMPHRVLLFVENEFHSETVLWGIQRIDPPADAAFTAPEPVK